MKELMVKTEDEAFGECLVVFAGTTAEWA